MQESSKSCNRSTRVKSSRKSVDSNTSSSTPKKNLYTAETTLTPVRKEIVVDVGRPAKKPKFNIDEEIDQFKDDSVCKEKKQDDFKKNDQLLDCQGDPHNNPEDRFNSDSEEPYVIPDSQVSGTSVRRMSLPLTRTTDRVYSPNMLNKTFTISSVCSEFDDTTKDQTKVQAKMIDSKDETVAEKKDNASVVNNDITYSGDSKAEPRKELVLNNDTTYSGDSKAERSKELESEDMELSEECSVIGK